MNDPARLGHKDPTGRGIVRGPTNHISAEIRQRERPHRVGLHVPRLGGSGFYRCQLLGVVGPDIADVGVRMVPLVLVVGVVTGFLARVEPPDAGVDCP